MSKVRVGVEGVVVVVVSSEVEVEILEMEKESCLTLLWRIAWK